MSTRSSSSLGAHDVETDAPRRPCADWERGPGASLRCGLAALAPEVEAAVVVLADGPDLAPEAIDRVIAAWRETGAEVLAASYGGDRGHPVLLARAAWGASRTRARAPSSPLLVPCDDLGSPGDVDSADDLEGRPLTSWKERKPRIADSRPLWHLKAAASRPLPHRFHRTRTPPKRDTRMELATALDHKRSPLAQARLQRQLPVREAAAKAGSTAEEVSWLERAASTGSDPRTTP